MWDEAKNKYMWLPKTFRSQEEAVTRMKKLKDKNKDGTFVAQHVDKERSGWQQVT